MAMSAKLEIQKALREYVAKATWHAPYAATLTMKQGRQVEGKNGMTRYQRLNALEASANMRHFLNRLNQHVYGNAADRYGKRVFVVPIMEGGLDKRLHYHATIDCPRDDLKDGYPELIASLWEQTPWGYKNNHITPQNDDGWTKYMTKLRDKMDYADSIDSENLHV